jgi:hypothetical protein
MVKSYYSQVHTFQIVFGLSVCLFFTDEASSQCVQSSLADLESMFPASSLDLEYFGNMSSSSSSSSLLPTSLPVDVPDKSQAADDVRILPPPQVGKRSSRSAAPVASLCACGCGFIGEVKPCEGCRVESIRSRCHTAYRRCRKCAGKYGWFRSQLSKIQAFLKTSSPPSFYCAETYVAKRLEKIPADQLNALKEIIDPLPPPLIGLDAWAMAVTMRTFRPPGSNAKVLSFSLLEQTLDDWNEVVAGFVTKNDLRSLRVALTHGGGSIVSSTQLHAVKWWLNDVVSWFKVLAREYNFRCDR